MVCVSKISQNVIVRLARLCEFINKAPEKPKPTDLKSQLTQRLCTSVVFIDSNCRYVTTCVGTRLLTLAIGIAPRL